MARVPDLIAAGGEGRASTEKPPLFQRRAGLFQPGMPESLREPVQEDLGLQLLIPFDVRPDLRANPASRFARSVSVAGPSLHRKP